MEVEVDIKRPWSDESRRRWCLKTKWICHGQLLWQRQTRFLCARCYNYVPDCVIASATKLRPCTQVDYVKDVVIQVAAL